MTMFLPLTNSVWEIIRDGDPLAAQMYLRSYASDRSRQRRIDRKTLQFVGPGEKMVLTTPCRRALFAWRISRLRDDDQEGVECTVFRNEGAGVASELVRAADAIADRRWPGERHFTFVNPRKVRGNPPGNVFRRAGWRPVVDVDGEPVLTKERKLLIFERDPA